MWMKANPEPRGQANENYGKSSVRTDDLETDGHPTRTVAQQKFNTTRKKVEKSAFYI